MSEFSERPKGIGVKKTVEGAKVEKVPDMPVRIVDGSELFHPDARCGTLAEEQEKFKNHGIGRLLSDIREEDKLTLCPDCDPKRFVILPPKRPFDYR